MFGYHEENAVKENDGSKNANAKLLIKPFFSLRKALHVKSDVSAKNQTTHTGRK